MLKVKGHWRGFRPCARSVGVPRGLYEEGPPENLTLLAQTAGLLSQAGPHVVSFQ